MHTIGRIEIEKYKCIARDIQTDEVVITEERIQHIRKRHPGDYEVIEPFLPEALCAPDYILKDADKTGLLLKHIETEDIRFQMVLRVQTSTDTQGYKNSIISAWRINESRWKNYIRNKKILYRSE